jgi:hypothetical protein
LNRSSVRANEGVRELKAGVVFSLDHEGLLDQISKLVVFSEIGEHADDVLLGKESLRRPDGRCYISVARYQRSGIAHIAMEQFKELHRNRDVGFFLLVSVKQLAAGMAFHIFPLEARELDADPNDLETVQKGLMPPGHVWICGF